VVVVVVDEVLERLVYVAVGGVSKAMTRLDLMNGPRVVFGARIRQRDTCVVAPPGCRVERCAGLGIRSIFDLAH
jgi:hypothetical protein